MWSILETLIAAVVGLAAMVSAYYFSDTMQKEQMRDSYAQQLAVQWTTFGKALYQYAQNNQNALTRGINYVTCSTLQSASYLPSTFSCNDALGQELRGVIANPFGVIQTVAVFPATAPSIDVFQRLGIQDPLSEKAFILKVGAYVKKLNSQYSLVNIDQYGYFQTIFGDTDNIFGYLTGQNGNGLVVPVAFARDTNTYPFAPVLFPVKSKSVGYWVWSFTAVTSGIQFTNNGWQPVCPDSRGLPQVYSPIVRGYNYNAGLNYLSGYICFPATQEMVSNNSSASIPMIPNPSSDDRVYSYFSNNGNGYCNSNRECVVFAWACYPNFPSSKSGYVIRVSQNIYTLFVLSNLCGSYRDSSGGLIEANAVNFLIFVQGQLPNNQNNVVIYMWPGFEYNIYDIANNAGTPIQNITLAN